MLRNPPHFLVKLLGLHSANGSCAKCVARTETKRPGNLPDRLHGYLNTRKEALLTKQAGLRSTQGRRGRQFILGNKTTSFGAVARSEPRPLTLPFSFSDHLNSTGP